MLSLSQINPDVAEVFQAGGFCVQKTKRAFSSLPIDHAHEQNNKCVKGDGGAIGLTQDSMQLLRWMVSGPEVARAVNEFDACIEIHRKSTNRNADLLHHEEVHSSQSLFQKQVLALTNSIETMGNPFSRESSDLLVLDTNEIADDGVVNTVNTIETLGNRLFQEYTEQRIVRQTVPFSDPISRNKLTLFSTTHKVPSKSKEQISSLKDSCALFLKLYISCQVREANLDEFFAHENQTFPPSIATGGIMRNGSKSDLLPLLGKQQDDTSTPDKSPTVRALVIDGAAVINMLKPNAACKTFKDYSEKIFAPYLMNQMKNIERLDIVWDQYFDNSLKAATRIKRGKGTQHKVEASAKIPSGGWSEFLREDKNKSELFAFLADQIVLINCQGKLLYSTKGDSVISSSAEIIQCHTLSQCTHEEADTRMLLHVLEIANSGVNKVMILTVDTDVVVLSISCYTKLNLTELWIAFGTGKSFRYIPVHKIVSALGQDKCEALPFFHAFTGCDQTSSFYGRGKRTCWTTWMASSDVQLTHAFTVLSNMPDEEVLLSSIPALEKFTVHMYDRTLDCTKVDEARKVLFSQKGRSLDCIPPTSAALVQHTKRAAFQAGYCWGQCLVTSPIFPVLERWGWKKGTQGVWEPLWSTLPEASKACQELIRFGCKSGCKGGCSCVKAGLKCTSLCKCGGKCKE